MSKVAGRNGDFAFFLYGVPFVINFLYALYLWSGVGFSSTLPQLVFLEVTQNPYIFLAGFAAVALAGVLDFDSEPAERRRAGVLALSKRLQTVALVSIVLAFLAAWYSAGGDLGNALVNMLDGRYPLVFPGLLVFFSFVILPSVKLQGANLRNLLVVVLLVASPAALYEIGKRNTIGGLGVALILLLLGAYFLVRGKKD